jgi:Pyridine nucleotide-disulphide oxidoreductase
MVLVVVGAWPDTQVAAGAGASSGASNAIAVDRQMRTSVPDVYAASDCVVTHHWLIGETYLPLGTTAHKRGRVAGENAADGNREFADSLGTQVVKIFEHAAARTGLRDHEARAAGFDTVTTGDDADDRKAYYPGSHRIALVRHRQLVNNMGMQSSEPPSVEAAAKSSDVVAQPFLRRIEKLALTFLRHRVESPEDLWQFQLNLLHLQREIQAAIGDYKGKAKREKGAMEALTDLRACRWHARRLGDAFAWVVLGRNMQIITPLSANERTALSPDSHGNRGMLLMARHLASQGWGFPVIHDITDCLRIGDLTFVRMSADSETSYDTVEVKTRAQLKRRLKAQNIVEYEYRIQALSAASFNAEQADPVTLESAELIMPSPVRPVSRHTGRQLKRTSTARLHQTAEPNVLIREDGEVPALWAPVTSPVTEHWKSLQRVVRKARRYGYASECVDGTFLYVAIYSSEGLSRESMGYSSRLQEDLLNPVLLIEDGAGANVLSIAIIPPFEQAGPHLFLPFYLYPIPRSLICNILRGRMIILVCTNEGRLVQSLEEAGFSVEFNSKVKRGPLTVTCSATAGNGAEYRVQSPNLRHYLDEIIYEFRGRDSIVQAAKAVFDAAANVVAEPDRGSEREGIIPGNTQPTN